ncbi:MAG: hypothetical protein COB14_02425 [Alphaproteobacteria bacterium]|nr:MAG: hypothetical protein COB14_02425 [Alphaproteobacteria bacterium]
MKDTKERDNYITSRKNHATSQNDAASLDFWNEVDTHLKTITEENDRGGPTCSDSFAAKLSSHF